MITNKECLNDTAKSISIALIHLTEFMHRDLMGKDSIKKAVNQLQSSLDKITNFIY